jgi:hypothetical protein
MTPIKELWVIGLLVLFVDYSGHTNPIAEAVNEAQAELLGTLLCSYHKKPLFIFDASQRSLIEKQSS